MCIRTVPFGYAVEKGKKVIVADEAAVIIEVYEHYCSGETFKQIADSLTARGVKYLPLSCGEQNQDLHGKKRMESENCPRYYHE